MRAAHDDSGASKDVERPDRAAPATLAVNPPGTDLTVYPVIDAPPSLAGAAHDTDADPFPAVATTPDGAPGTPAAAVTCSS